MDGNTLDTQDSRDYYFEDLPVGFAKRGGSWLLTGEDIIEFAKIYDPLPIHIDREAAKNSEFGCLIAAGVHLLSIAAGLNHQLQGQDRYHYIAGLGYSSIRFIVPGREGDTLSLEFEVVEARRSASDPGKGIIELVQSLLNQDGEIVVRTVGKAMVKTRAGMTQ